MTWVVGACVIEVRLAEIARAREPLPTDVRRRLCPLGQEADTAGVRRSIRLCEVNEVLLRVFRHVLGLFQEPTCNYASREA